MPYIACYDDARRYRDELARKPRAELQRLAPSWARSNCTKQRLIDLIVQPYVDRLIRADKERAIRAPGAL